MIVNYYHCHTKETLLKQKVRPNVTEILENHSEVFSTNMGKAVDKQVTIMTEQTVTPVVQKPGRVLKSSYEYAPSKAVGEFARTVVHAERVMFMDDPAPITMQDIR